MGSPSPTCTVNAGSVPADVTASSTVTIALANPAGANLWFLQAIGTDETNTSAAINATLVIDQTTKTATFTAPSGLGSAVVFKSTVGIGNGSSLAAGLDLNGQVQQSYTTTFEVNVLTAGAARVIAVNETYENDPVFGWLSKVNGAIRGAGGGGIAVTNVVANDAATVITQTTGWVKLSAKSFTADRAVTLPASPGDGMVFTAGDGDGSLATNNFNISANGKQITDLFTGAPASSTNVGGTAGAALTWIYVAALNTWTITVLF